MKTRREPRRLVDPRSDFADDLRSMLAVADADLPDAEARARVSAMLGPRIGPAQTVPPSAPLPAPPPLAPVPAGGALLAGGLKMLAPLVLAGGLVAAAVGVGVRHDPSRAASLASAPRSAQGPEPRAARSQGSPAMGLGERVDEDPGPPAVAGAERNEGRVGQAQNAESGGPTTAPEGAPKGRHEAGTGATRAAAPGLSSGATPARPSHEGATTAVVAAMTQGATPPGIASGVPAAVAAPSASAPVTTSSASALAAPNTPVSGAAVELALLAEAERVLRDDPSRALSLTDEHARRFAAGALAQERDVIAIEALVRSGRRGEAAARAAAFLARYPSSAHASRVRTLVSEKK